MSTVIAYILKLGYINYVFILGFVWFAYYNISDFKKRYRKLKKILENINDIFEKNSEEYFQLNYENIKKDILKEEIVGDIWREYDKTLVRVPHSSSPTLMVRRSCDASYYFNNDIISSEMDVDMFNAVPSYFTGIGIFGTFLGLSIGIFGMDLRTENIDILKAGVKNMLGGMSTAFVTSLVGLFIALPFSFFTKRYIGTLRVQMSLLQSNIDKKLPHCGMESLLQESRNELAAQTAEIKQFKGDLANSICDAVSNGVSNNLQPTLEKLCASIEGLEKNLAASIYDAVNDGVTKNLQPALEKLHGAIQELNSSGSSAVSETIRGSVGDKIDELKDIIGSTTDVAKNLNEQSGKMGAQFESLMKESSSRMAGIYEKSSAQQSEQNTKIMEHMGEMMTMIKSTMDSTVTQFSSVHNTANSQMNRTFSDISEQLISLVGVIEETQSQSNKLLTETVSGISDKFALMSENLLSQSKAQSESSSKITGDTIGKLSEMMENFSAESNSLLRGTLNDISNKLTQVSDSLLEQSKAQSESSSKIAVDTINRLNEMAETFATVTGVNNMEMAGYVKEIKELLDSCSDVMDGANSTADSFKDAALPVRESADSLKENLVVLNAAQRDFMSFSDTIMAKAEKNNDASAQTLEHLSSLIRNTDDTVRKYKESFDGLANDMNDVFGKLHDGLLDYGEVTRKNMEKQLEETDGKVAEMMGYIGGGIEELGELFENLEKIAENFSGSSSSKR